MNFKNLSRRIGRALPRPDEAHAADLLNQSPPPPPPPAAPPPPAGEKPFYDTFKDADLKTWAGTAKLTDVEGTVKQLRDSQTALGSRVPIPKEGDDPTKWEHWDKLGAKSKAEDYSLKKPEMPAGMEWDKDGEKLLLDTAVKMKAPAHIAQGFLDAYAQREAQAFTARKAVADQDAKELTTLFTTWGSEKDANLQDAQRAAKHFGIQGDVTTAIVGFMGGAKILNGLAALGKGMRESGFVEGEGGGGGVESAKTELKALNDKLGKPGGSLTSDEAKRRTELYKIIYPGKQGQ